MLCEKCKKREANVHFTEIVDGEKKVLNICEVCAKENDIHMEMDFKLPLTFKDFFSDYMDMEKNMDFLNIETEIICDECKCGYKRFEDTGMMGCSSCYSKFEEKMLTVIEKIQSDTKHVGKSPKKLQVCIKAKKEIARLKEELKEAVYKEEFEDAVIIRDKIKELERGTLI